jgi:hypothetical protein
MTKLRWLAVAGILVCLGLALPFTLPTPPLVPGVTKANFCRIQEGMTKAEVEMLLGRQGSSSIRFIEGTERGPSPPNECKAWIEDKFVIGVSFNQDGIVIDKEWCDLREGAFQQLCRWLHLK